MNPGCTHIQQRTPSFLKRARPRLFHSGLSLERAHQGAQWARIPENGAGQRMRPGGQFSMCLLWPAVFLKDVLLQPAWKVAHRPPELSLILESSLPRACVPGSPRRSLCILLFFAHPHPASIVCHTHPAPLGV